MLEYRESLAPFRARGNRNMYELSFTLVSKEQKEIEIKEMIDAYPGEVGRRYAENILFRIGNEIIKETELEMIPWKKADIEKFEEGKEFGYMKRGKGGSRLFAFVRWYGAKKETVR